LNQIWAFDRVDGVRVESSGSGDVKEPQRLLIQK
jgi:hypothetical protein